MMLMVTMMMTMKMLKIAIMLMMKPLSRMCRSGREENGG